MFGITLDLGGTSSVTLNQHASGNAATVKDVA